MTTRVKGHPTLSKNHALNRGMDTSVAPSKKKKKKKMNKKADAAQGTRSADSGCNQIAERADIDDLFASAKATKDEDERRRQEEEEEEERLADEFEAIEKAARKSGSSSTYGIIKSPNMPQIINPEAPVERIDPETGFPVYKAHLLKVGEGGGTPLCPFDCNCCF